MIVSLEDELFQTNAKIATEMAKRIMGAARTRSTLATRMLRYVAQAVAEKRNARIREHVFKQDRQLERFMAFSGPRE